MTTPFGRSIRRKEDPRFLAGRGRYLDDLRLPAVLHAAIVRSSYAHARILGIEGDAARAMPGVVAVLTSAELPECEGAVPPLLIFPTLRAYRHPALASGTVRHVGEPVAVVVAEDRYQAADAALAVRIAYEPLPVAASVEAALAPRGAARLRGLARQRGGAVRGRRGLGRGRDWRGPGRRRGSTDVSPRGPGTAGAPWRPGVALGSGRALHRVELDPNALRGPQRSGGSPRPA